MKRVLITGTTSGLGKALVYEYLNRGWEIIAVNRRANPDSMAHRNYVCDVCDRKGIAHLLEQERDQPIDLYLLNAGINRVDFDGIRLDSKTYNEVLDTNFTGVQNVINEAMTRIRTEHVTFVCVSSTTLFFENPYCRGYAASKRMVHEHFAMLDHLPRSLGIGRRFKSLVLGPIATNICVTNTGSRFQNWVRKVITVSPEQAARRIANFLDGNQQTFYYPLPVCALFWLAGKINHVMPFYKGSR